MNCFTSYYSMLNNLKTLISSLKTEFFFIIRTYYYYWNTTGIIKNQDGLGKFEEWKPKEKEKHRAGAPSERPPREAEELLEHITQDAHG